MIGIAWAALFLWPFVAVVFFRNLSLLAAVTATILGGYLFLPSALWWDPPLLPSLNKISISCLTALVLTVVTIRQNPQIQTPTGWLPRSPVIRILLLMLLGGSFGTVLTNTDPIVYAPTVLPGLTLFDGFSMAMNWAVVLAPFILGRLVLASSQAQHLFLKAIVIFAVAYSILALWEIRMSPLLHVQIYGFYPSQFLQQIRGDGFRAVVFLNHGLAVALFFAFSVIAAGILLRNSQGNERLLWLLALVWLCIILVLCKSLGPLMIAVVLLPVALFFSVRMQLITALSIVVLVSLYPVLRAVDVIPVDRILEFAASINPARAQSFGVRLSNESELLAKAMERPVFGWGIWGRSRVYNEYGLDTTIADGSWIIDFSQGGWVRYIAIFGLLWWPIIACCRKGAKNIDLVCSGLILLLCVKLVDLIPNSGIEPFIFLCAGGLVGRLEEGNSSRKSHSERASYNRNLSPTPRYARDFSRSEKESVFSNSEEKQQGGKRSMQLRADVSYRR